MKKLYISFAVAAMFSLTSCIEEIDPQTTTVTQDQAANAPGSFQNFVNGLTNIVGKPFYGGGTSPYDFGYPSFFIMHDHMGQDMIIADTSGSEWWTAYYCCGTALGPQYAYCQIPMTLYYGWIKDCNNVIDMGGENIPEDRRYGVGIAYAMRALFYVDLTRMYCAKAYSVDPNALATIVHVTQPWSPYYTQDATHNDRYPNDKMWEFIISDLDMAEELLQGYTRPDIQTPDVSVVYALKARAYLEKCDWANAEKYAKMAQQGYSMLSTAEYLDRNTAFNTPNHAWIYGVTFKDNDPMITSNDSDSNWGSWMITEIDPVESGCGYAANYVGSRKIDRHLYETIPATDIRKMCYVDFAIDDMSKADALKALEAYSNYPEWVYNNGTKVCASGTVGGIQLKFRPAGGDAGYHNQYVGFCVSVPCIRVEEMMLIEAEAAGMQDLNRGIQLLTDFGKKRDPQYVYGSHNEAYGNPNTTEFINEIWWQRRVELWGEGHSVYDIKRLNKGIIRSYKNTNHWEGYRWNTTTPPQWMTRCFVQTESNYNYDLTQNELPVPPSGDSEEYPF